MLYYQTLEDNKLSKEKILKDKDEKKKGGTPAPEQKQTAPDTQSQARPATGAEPEKTWELGTAD